MFNPETNLSEEFTDILLAMLETSIRPTNNSDNYAYQKYALSTFAE
jgi:hypothetical protein